MVSKYTSCLTICHQTIIRRSLCYEQSCPMHATDRSWRRKLDVGQAIPRCKRARGDKTEQLAASQIPSQYGDLAMRPPRHLECSQTRYMHWLTVVVFEVAKEMRPDYQRYFWLVHAQYCKQSYLNQRTPASGPDCEEQRSGMRVQASEGNCGRVFRLWCWPVSHVLSRNL